VYACGAKHCHHELGVASRFIPTELERSMRVIVKSALRPDCSFERLLIDDQPRCLPGARPLAVRPQGPCRWFSHRWVATAPELCAVAEARGSCGCDHGSIRDAVSRTGLTLLRDLRKGLWLGETLGGPAAAGRTPELRLPPAPTTSISWSAAARSHRSERDDDGARGRSAGNGRSDHCERPGDADLVARPLHVHEADSHCCFAVELSRSGFVLRHAPAQRLHSNRGYFCRKMPLLLSRA
jgi:hypothetical protein